VTQSIVTGCLQLTVVSVICCDVTWLGRFLTRSVQLRGNEFELISTETRYLVVGSLVMNFRRSIIIAELWRHEVARCWKKTTRKDSLPLRSTRVVFKFCKIWKFDRREIGNIVRCLPDEKKTKIRLSLQLSLLRGSCRKSAKASPRQCTQSAPDFVQIGSLSAELYPNAWTPSERARK